MQRRYFLQALAAATASGFLPASASAQQTSSFDFASKKLFANNPKLTPLRGFRGQDIACDVAWIEGEIPSDLRGNFFRNGPGLFERGGQRYQHWFDGDGMVHAWRFGDAGVSHQARFVRTKKFVAEAQAGEFLVPAFGSAIKPKIPLRSSDTINTANTNVIQMDGRLLALWEGGSAHALDAQTLETQGIVSWSPDLASMPFSAHPKVEADGTMWNFGTMMGKVVLYQFSPRGKLMKHLVFDGPNSAMVHDFVVSQNHIIFLFSPIVFDPTLSQAGKSMVDSMVWHAEESTKVLVVKKSDFTQRKVFELPALMVFHFGNAWEAQGVIRLDFVQSNDLENFHEWIPKIMHGEDAHSQPSTPTFLKIDLNKGSLSMETRNENVEFPRVDPRFVAQRNRQLFYPYADRTTAETGLNGVMRLDMESGKIDRFSFGTACSLEEHVLVPKAGGKKEGEAWLVGVGFDIQAQQTFASVFDAQNLSAGPVALAHLPYWVPHCFHGNFYSRDA